MLVIYKKTGNSDGSPEMICDEMRNPSTVYENKVGDFPSDATRVLRYGCRGNVPAYVKEHLLRRGTYLNTASAIKFTSDKREFRRVLIQERGLALFPVTLFSTAQIEPDSDSFSREKYLIRPSQHSRGENIFLSNELAALYAVGEYIGEGKYYLQEYINKDAEYRVNFVQGKVVQVLRKFPEDLEAIVWNHSNTENIRWGDWPPSVISLANLAAIHSGLYMGGVDVITSNNCDEVYVLEVNTSPELTPYQARCFAKAIDWSIDNDNFDNLPLEMDGSWDWRLFIHPGLL